MMDNSILEAIDRAQQRVDRGQRVKSLADLALEIAKSGNLEGARSVFAIALATAHEIGREGDKARSLGAIALVFAQAGEVELAQATFRNALEIAAKIHDRFHKAGTHAKLAEFLAQAGYWGEAEQTVHLIEDASQREMVLEQLQPLRTSRQGTIF